jgi:ubiquinone biosynthesis monooxygenase Coq6
MARITENLNLQRGLLKHIEKLPIELIDKTKVQAIERGPGELGGWPVIQLSNGQTLRARLLVSASLYSSY